MYTVSNILGWIVNETSVSEPQKLTSINRLCNGGMDREYKAFPGSQGLFFLGITNPGGNNYNGVGFVNIKREVRPVVDPASSSNESQE